MDWRHIPAATAVVAASEVCIPSYSEKPSLRLLSGNKTLICLGDVVSADGYCGRQRVHVYSIPSAAAAAAAEEVMSVPTLEAFVTHLQVGKFSLVVHPCSIAIALQYVASHADQVEAVIVLNLTAATTTIAAAMSECEDVSISTPTLFIYGNDVKERDGSVPGCSEVKVIEVGVATEIVDAIVDFVGAHPTW